MSILEYQRRVVCAANRDPQTDHLILGARHWDQSMHIHHGLFVYAKYYDLKFSEQGFIDQHGVFMGRQEAWKVAKEAGQIIRRVPGDDEDGGTLYSENLY